MYLLFIFLFWLITGYLTLNVGYLVVSALAGRIGSADDRSLEAPVDRLRRIAVLIPAYKEDAVIISSVKANLKQEYPADLYDLIVIADSFQPATLTELSCYPVQVICVNFEQSTVQKAITYAMSVIPENTYDIVLISDADNQMAPDFLKRINQAFAQGWRAVQGHRKAKNTNHSVALFDAMNEEVNNTIFRAGQRALGLSAMCIGSGMAFEPALLKKALGQIKTVGGYDKEIEMLLTIDHVPVGYLQNAVIYDEKVQNIAVFNQQRTRWVAAQVYFLKAYFKIGFRQLAKGNIQAFNSLVRALLLPRMILITILWLHLLVSLLVGQPGLLLISLLLLGLILIGLAISVPTSLWRKLSIRDIYVLPLLILGMFRALFTFRKASKEFLHTPHVEASEV